MDVTLKTDAFRAWWDNGYREIIPVIPPDAPLSPRSYVAKNNSAGKAPGIRYDNGQWGGLPGWRDIQPTLDDLDAWSAMGASVGLRRGAAFLLDIDAYKLEVADEIERAAIEMLGPAPMRVGMWPKRALLYRAIGDIGGVKLMFDGEPPGQIEIPAQSVIWGVHKNTGKPYSWPRKPLPLDQLTAVGAADIEAFMDAMRRMLPEARRSDTASNADRQSIDQATLAGRPELVIEAVRRLPNTRELFPAYDDMIRVGNAISGALPHDRVLANELWHEWCEKWEGGDYDHELTEKRWGTLKPPHAYGAKWLFEQVDRAAPADTSFVARMWFDPLPDDLNPFEEVRAQEAATPTDVYPVLGVNDIVDRPPPEWLIERYVLKTCAGFIYAAPGVGKSFLVLDQFLSIAAGLPDWHGQKITTTEGLVVYIAGEGSYGFRNRIRAWMKERGVPADRLNRFRLIEKSINFLKADDVAKLIRTIRSIVPGGARLAAVAVDTVARSLPGADENSQKDMGLFIEACDKVKEAFGCAVVGVHHAGKNGDMRGSTVIPGGGDFVFKMTREKGASVGRIFCEKMKDGPDGWQEQFRLDVVDLDDGQSSLVPAVLGESFGGSAGLNPDVSHRILDAMAAAWASGSPWSLKPRAKDRYAVRRIVDDFGFDAATADSMVKLWVQSGFIGEEMVSKKDKKVGLRVYQTGIQHTDEETLFG